MIKKDLEKKIKFFEKDLEKKSLFWKKKEVEKVCKMSENYQRHRWKMMFIHWKMSVLHIKYYCEIHCYHQRKPLKNQVESLKKNEWNHSKFQRKIKRSHWKNEWKILREKVNPQQKLKSSAESDERKKKIIEIQKIQGNRKFSQRYFLGKKKKKDTKLSGFWRLREKNFGKKKKIYIRGVKMHI